MSHPLIVNCQLSIVNCFNEVIYLASNKGLGKGLGALLGDFSE